MFSLLLKDLIFIFLLIELQKLNVSGSLSNLSVAKNATYSSRAAGKKFQNCLAQFIHGKILDQIQSATMYSVLTDESTDISLSEQMVVYIRIVDENLKPQTIFLKHMTF